METGPVRSFAEWPDPTVPKIAAGVYTVWDQDYLVYVGMAGRAITGDRTGSKPTGLWDRLRSHAEGRRSGNQFCVYVCDRFIVPHLTPDEQAQIGAGALSLDHLTRRYIHDKLAYRYVITATPHRSPKRGAAGAVRRPASRCPVPQPAARNHHAHCGGQRQSSDPG
jgi:hypothetical protein